MDDDTIYPDAVDGEEVESLEQLEEQEDSSIAPHTDGPEATDIIPPGVDEGEE
jgi:hypothetical protein